MCENCKKIYEYVDEKELTHFAHYEEHELGYGSKMDAYYCNSCKTIFTVEVDRKKETDNWEIKEVAPNEEILRDIAFFRLLPEPIDCFYAQNVFTDEEVFMAYRKIMSREQFEGEMKKLRYEFKIK